MKYSVSLMQKVFEAATVEVEASSEEDAEEKALDAALNGWLDWEFVEAPDLPWVADVKETP